MKKMIAVITLIIFTPALFAGNNNEQITARLGVLEQTVNNLQTQINALSEQISNSNMPRHHIGEIFQGGIIFYLDETGEHGLIVSQEDLNQGAGIQWRNGDSGNKVTNARADGLGAGAINTLLIIAEQTIDHQSGRFAALVASTFKVSGDGLTPCDEGINPNTLCFSDWYLPSISELRLIHQDLKTQGVAAFDATYYWSSTEISTNTAWMQNFSTGEAVSASKASTTGHIRAVRKF